jgi:hypothetical protein
MLALNRPGTCASHVRTPSATSARCAMRGAPSVTNDVVGNHVQTMGSRDGGALEAVERHVVPR